MLIWQDQNWKISELNKKNQEKTVPQFFKTGFRFLKKICFKFEVFKTVKISSDFNIKTCRSRKRRAIQKNPYYCFLEEPKVFLLTLKENLYKKTFSTAKTKAISYFAVKFVERSSYLPLENHLRWNIYSELNYKTLLQL